MICYAFPVAHEAELLLKKCTQRESFTIGRMPCTLANLGARQVLIAGFGMGQARARENAEQVFRYFRPKAVVLAGYGGALVSQLKLGQILVSNNFTSEELLPFLRLLSGFDFATFCTADEIAGTTEKRDWYAHSMKAQVLDMETAVVADVVRAREIPFLAVRVISDEYKTVLPAAALAAGYDPEHNRATPVRLLKHLALHPKDLRPLKEFVRNLAVARHMLTLFVEQVNSELPRGW
jgi:adenosylhomocysteine nucleosidase